MRVFFDTNVLLAAFLAEGTCKVVFRLAVDGEITGVVCEGVLEELRRNLGKLVKIPRERRSSVVEVVRASCDVVPTPKDPPRRCRDATDDAILAAAAASADILVTGDKDLLALPRAKAGIETLRPADLLRKLA